jgi:hypothetical protein
MKTITLWQPWASFIAWGWKSIETRTHIRFRHLIGQTIGIHAGLHWDKDWKLLAGKYLAENQIKKIYDLKGDFQQNIFCNTNDSNIRGSIICTAWVESFDKLEKYHSTRALIDCEFTTRFGLFLPVINIIQPIPIKGHQGAWNYDGEIIYL